MFCQQLILLAGRLVGSRTEQRVYHLLFVPLFVLLKIFLNNSTLPKKGSLRGESRAPSAVGEHPDMLHASQHAGCTGTPAQWQLAASILRDRISNVFRDCV